MNKEFSTSWKASKRPRKQHKYLENAPLHLRRKFFSAHLAEALITKYKIKTLPVRKGDSVKVMRGQFKKLIGKVTKVDLKKIRIYIEGIELQKKDGSKIPYPIHPSKVQIENLVLDDKERKALVEGSTK